MSLSYEEFGFIRNQLECLEVLQRETIRKIEMSQAAIDSLTLAVAALEAKLNEAVTYIQGIPAQIAAAQESDDDTALNTLTARITSDAATLGASLPTSGTVSSSTSSASASVSSDPTLVSSGGTVSAAVVEDVPGAATVTS